MSLANVCRESLNYTDHTRSCCRNSFRTSCGERDPFHFVSSLPIHEIHFLSHRFAMLERMYSSFNYFKIISKQDALKFFCNSLSLSAPSSSLSNSLLIIANIFDLQDYIFNYHNIDILNYVLIHTILIIYLNYSKEDLFAMWV